MNPLVTAVVVGIAVLFIFIIIDLLLVPFQARRIVEKLLRRKAPYDPRALENPKYGTVVGGSDCLRIMGGKSGESELQWKDVEEVLAYKRDLYTTDLICLAFKKSGKEEYHEIHEEMAGYHDLLETLPNYLPRFTMEWCLSVAVPAFETNHHMIWKKSPN